MDRKKVYPKVITSHSGRVSLNAIELALVIGCGHMFLLTVITKALDCHNYT